MKPGRHYPELRQAVIDYMALHGLSHNATAINLGVSRLALTQLLQGGGIRRTTHDKLVTGLARPPHFKPMTRQESGHIGGMETRARVRAGVLPADFYSRVGRMNTGRYRTY